jgi:hypothetical protein
VVRVRGYDAAATEGGMTFELSAEDAALVREFVEGRLVELKKEINRTENSAFREELRKIQRALERLLSQLTQSIPEPP